MARASKLVTIDAANRDRGKVFLVTEMPPRQSEKWATRALLAVSRSNSSLGAEAGELADSGMAGLAAIGFRALSSLEFEDAEPLLDEMLSCVSFVPDPAKIDQLTQRPDRNPYGFFARRLPLDLGGDGQTEVEFERYPNVAYSVGTVVSAGLATLHEVDTVLGLEDIYDLLEILAVDTENKRRAHADRD